MSLLEEFKAFVAKGNVVDLAIAVVVGGAFGKIVTAFVDGIVMPLVSYVLPSGMTWESWMLGKLRIGMILSASLNFLIIAGVVFVVLVKMLGRVMKRKDSAVAAVTTKECPRCLEPVPIKATRCKHCTSELS